MKKLLTAFLLVAVLPLQARLELRQGDSLGSEPVISGYNIVLVPFRAYLPWSEFVFLILAALFGIMLCCRSRKAHHLLLVFAAILFAMDLVPWLVASISATSSSVEMFGIMQIMLYGQHWPRPLGALLLATYVIICWLCSPRPDVR
jgi:hypothetical protein